MSSAGCLPIIPGWLATPADWQPGIQQLANQHTCYIWEARPWYHDRPTIAAMADDLQALVAALAPEAPTVLGHSMGALTPPGGSAGGRRGHPPLHGGAQARIP